MLHYLEYSYTTDSIEDFYDEASWICLSNEEYDKKERIKLFKIDVVKPLCDYVTDELRKTSLYYTFWIDSKTGQCDLNLLISRVMQKEMFKTN